MNMASLELCRELYKLSGWDDTYWVLVTWWNSKNKNKDDAIRSVVNNAEMYHNKSSHWHEVYKFDDPVFQYDLGYLLRKLPATTSIQLQSDEEANADGQKWAALYYKYGLFADTPEDAACSLAIELFKQGILTK